MDLKGKVWDVVKQIDLLGLFCFVMALLSWLLPIGMVVIWVVLGLLYQAGRAEGLKSALKGMMSVAPKPKATITG